MKTASAPPLPGVFFGMPFDQYCDIDAVNFSSLKVYDKCPLLYYKKYIAKTIPDKDDTEALIVGSATHKLVLEGEGAFEKDYVVVPKTDKRSKEGKALAAVYAEQASLNGKILLESDDYALICALREGVESNDAALALLAEATTEVTIVAQDPDTGLWLKGRIDALTLKYVLDLKTDRDLDDFSWTIESRGYYRQLAWYLWLLSLASPDASPTEAALIAVEKQEPYRCEVYAMSPSLLSLGREENLDSLRALCSSLRTDDWPSGRPGIHEIKPSERKLQEAARRQLRYLQK